MLNGHTLVEQRTLQPRGFCVGVRCVTTILPNMRRAPCGSDAPQWTSVHSGLVSFFIQPVASAEAVPRVLPPSLAPCLRSSGNLTASSGVNP
eukprot:8231977-Pyramimonas_sp.AAC.1